MLPTLEGRGSLWKNRLCLVFCLLGMVFIMQCYWVTFYFEDGFHSSGEHSYKSDEVIGIVKSGSVMDNFESIMNPCDVFRM